MSFSFCFSPMRRAALFALASSFLAALAFAAGNAFSFLVFVILAAGNALLILALWYSLQAMLFSFLPFVAFGTGEGLLRYGIRIRCSKQAPGVRDAFSEAFGAKNRLLRYGRDIRYQKPPSLVRNRSLDAKKGHHRNNKKEQDKSCDLSCLVAGAGLEPTTSGL